MDMTQLLERMGWDGDVRVPIANEANRALEDKIMKLVGRRTKALQEQEQLNNRLATLDKHCHHLLQESIQNQKLILEYKRQISAVESDISVKKASRDQLKQKSRELRNRIAETIQRQQSKREDLVRGQLRMDTIKAQANWDADALKAWEEALRTRDEDTELLQTFTQQDAHKITQLDRRREVLSLDVASKTATLNKMISNITNYETSLNRSYEILKNQKRESATLMKRWQMSAQNLQRRNASIAASQDETEQCRQRVKEAMETLEEESEFLANEQSNNRALEAEIATTNSEINTTKQKLEVLESHVLNTNSEKHTRKTLLVSSANRLEKERLISRQVAADIAMRKAQITKITSDIEKMKSKAEEVLVKSNQAANAAQNLEQIVDTEKRVHNELLRSTQRMESTIHVNEDRRKCLREEMKTICNEISNLEKTVCHLTRKSQKEKQNTENHYATIYDLGLRLSILTKELQSDVDRRKPTDEQTETLRNLEIKYQKYCATRDFVKAQLKEVREDVYRIQIQIDNGECYAKLQDRLADLKVLHSGGMKQCAAALKSRLQRQVDENMFRLRLSQIMKADKRHDEQIYNHHQCKLELDTSMRERELEIAAVHEVLVVKKRCLDEDMSRLRGDMTDRQVTLVKFQNKHYLALTSLGKNQNGKDMTLARFKIENDSLKCDLLRYKAELTNKISKVESDNKAMNISLQLMTTCNAKFRQSYSNEGCNMDELNRLNDKIRVRILKVDEMKHKHSRMEDEKDELRMAIKQLEASLEEYQAKWGELTSARTRADKEQIQCTDRIKKVTFEIKRKSKLIPDQKLHLYDMQLYIRTLKDVNKRTLDEMRRLSSQSIETCDKITAYLANFNINLPRAREKVEHTNSSISSSSMLSIRSLPSCSSVNTCSSTRKSPSTITLQLKTSPPSSVLRMRPQPIRRINN